MPVQQVGIQKETESLTLGLCRARDCLTIDQQLKYGVKCARASGTKIEHPQFVRLLYSQRLHYRERRTIDRVWIAPDDFHEILPCLERAVLAKLVLRNVNTVTLCQTVTW